MAEPLPIWVIYDKPRDYPLLFVARLWLTDQATDTLLRDVTLEGLRAQLEAKGLACLARHPDDDPVIVEAWV